MNIRGRWLGALGVLTIVLGSGRLAMDEVQLAGSDARTRGLEQRADGAARDRYRLVRLEQELETERARVVDLDAQLDAGAREVAALTSSVAVQREELVAVRRNSTQATERLAASLRTAEERLVQRKQELRALEQVAQERAQALVTAESRVEEAGRALAAAEVLSLQRAESLAKSLEQVREQGRTLAGQRQALGRLEGGLKAAVDRAQHSEDVLARLETAGVNVARLSGQRPMPRLSAVVVRVDGDAVPPTVLIDVGRGSGIELRDILYLIRNGTVVAELEVAEVGEQVSSAKVIQGQRGLKLRTGEDVSSVRP